MSPLKNGLSSLTHSPRVSSERVWCAASKQRGPGKGLPHGEDRWVPCFVQGLVFTVFTIFQYIHIIHACMHLNILACGVPCTMEWNMLRARGIVQDSVLLEFQMIYHQKIQSMISLSTSMNQRTDKAEQIRPVILVTAPLVLVIPYFCLAHVPGQCIHRTKR